MKKMLTLMLLGMFVLGLGFASADTMIAGKIYNNDYTLEVEGADVIVTCNGNVNETTSNAVGSYGVMFTDNECPVGETVTVYANHSKYGSNTVDIYDSDKLELSTDMNLGIANIPLVPEFGFMIGMLTILSAVGVFFVVRRD